MKKVLIIILATFMSALSFAYNPPAGGQSLWTLASPTLLTSANSSAGGAVFMPSAESINLNPALTAMENRVQLEASMSGIINAGDYGDDFNCAFQTGILIPSKMFVFSGLTQGIFCEAEDLWLADSINLRIGFSKRVFENLSFGVNLFGGALWDAGSDWSIGADVGFLFRKEKLGFAKDFRIGAAIMNLGKVYDDTELFGIKENGKVDGFPTFCTVKTGVAADFIKTDNIVLGCSFDMTIPFFQNLILDAGFQVLIKDRVFVSVAQTIDIQECVEGFDVRLPSVSVGYKFNLNVKRTSYTEKHDWIKNDMSANLGWKQCASKVHAVSAGVKLKLGQEDKAGPQIQLWDEEDGE